MALKSTPSRPATRPVPQARRRSKDAPTPALALPHESDESVQTTAKEPDPVIVQAQHDLDAGMVDTDMHATPGLDAELRARLVPGAGGIPRVVVPPTLADQKSDFTAEGAPPPGKVANSPPVRSDAPDKPKR